MIQRDGDILRVGGAMTLAEAASLEREGIVMLRAGGVRAVDLSAVETTDSAGLALLLAWQRAAPGAFVVTGMPDTLDALGRLYGAEAVLQRFAAGAA